MSTIHITYGGSSVSLEHLGNMAVTAQAVMDTLKARGSKRHENQKRDKKPHDDYVRGSYRSRPDRVVDPANMVMRHHVEVLQYPKNAWEAGRNVDGTWVPGRFTTEWERYEYTYTTTWHDQFVDYGVGSVNSRKAGKSYRRAARRDERRENKLAQKRQKVSTRDYVHQAGKDQDFEPWKRDGWVHQSAGADSLDGAFMRCDRIEEANFDFTAGAYRLVTERAIVDLEAIEAERRNEAYRIATAQRRAEAAAKREAKRQEFLAKQRQHWANVYQRPEADAKAKAALRTSTVMSRSTK